MFTRPKVTKPETETLYLQDRDETETFQKNVSRPPRDGDVQHRDYIPVWRYLYYGVLCPWFDRSRCASCHWLQCRLGAGAPRSCIFNRGLSEFAAVYYDGAEGLVIKAENDGLTLHCIAIIETFSSCFIGVHRAMHGCHMLCHQPTLVIWLVISVVWIVPYSILYHVRLLYSLSGDECASEVEGCTVIGMLVIPR